MGLFDKAREVTTEADALRCLRPAGMLIRECCLTDRATIIHVHGNVVDRNVPRPLVLVLFNANLIAYVMHVSSPVRHHYVITPLGRERLK